MMPIEGDERRLGGIVEVVMIRGGEGGKGLNGGTERSGDAASLAGAAGRR